MRQTRLAAALAAVLAGAGLARAEIVVNSVEIAGPPEAVFDLVTTARFWPTWHPASKGVKGVTERPYRLGDRVIETAGLGALVVRVPWKVVEHAAMSRVVLQSETSPAKITYYFEPGEAATKLTRVFEFSVPANVPPERFVALMRAQSAQAAENLKIFVEKTLQDEFAAE